MSSGPSLQTDVTILWSWTAAQAPPVERKPQQAPTVAGERPSSASKLARMVAGIEAFPAASESAAIATPHNASESTAGLPAVHVRAVRLPPLRESPATRSMHFWKDLPEKGPALIASRSFATEQPEVESTPLAKRMLTPRVLSFMFDVVPVPELAPEKAARPAAMTLIPERPSKYTHFLPPEECVSLEDRLRYLLQPPVETWATQSCLEFPGQPFPYQWQGVAFLYPRRTAVLADEMGLGKTIQAITALRLLLHAGEIRNVLLVCPKPLVSNWKREFSLWAPELPVAIVEGDSNKRTWQWQLHDVPVRIANYELVLRDRELLETCRRPFDLVVLDESQRIKNKSSATSQAVRGIRRNRSWALTGTPVENSLDDLLGIFEFLAPGYLHAGMEAQTLGKLARDHLLRREKSQVLTELPPKLYRDAELDLRPEQRETYELAEKEGVLRLSEMGDAATIQHVFELVLRLKQICNFDPATGASAKLERLQADLEEVAASGKKAIVFSQWVATLERLAGHLSAFRPLQFHGKIPANKRDAVIERFREDQGTSVMLMSYGAGSVGLNLQCAGYVFLFDRWWNPAVEDQAINRAHRIGALGPVTVSRFLTTETIEQRIHEVLERKRELFQSLFGEAEIAPTAGWSEEELFGLFRLSMPGQAAPPGVGGRPMTTATKSPYKRPGKRPAA